MKRAFLLFVVLAVAAPASALAAQRFARERGGQFAFGDGVTPSQVWRVRTLTMDQRLKLSELQKTMFARCETHAATAPVVERWPGRSQRRNAASRAS